MQSGAVLGGKYRVERVLGEGGMGRVVAALHEQLGQRVAIKYLLPEALSHPDVTARFMREARAAVQLRSEHVGRVIDVGTFDDGTPYMVMEYLEGCDLKEQIKTHGPAPLPVAVDYLLQACDALAEAHSRGIIHRDVKPANLFLTHTSDGSPLIKVLDFGIAKAGVSDVDMNLTKTTTIMGSPGYMSPEQLRSSRDVDARADIWGLGIVLYELLSGHGPFEAETFSELVIKVATDPLPPLQVQGVSPEFRSILERCLAKEADYRFQNVAELAAVLEPFGSERSIGAAARVARVLNVSASGPTGATAVITRSTPTTLGGATGQKTGGGGRSKLPFIAGGAIIAIGAVIGIVLATGGGSSEAEPTAAPVAVPADAGVPVAVQPPDAAAALAAQTPPDAAPLPPDAALARTPASDDRRGSSGKGGKGGKGADTGDGSGLDWDRRH
jgi:eukaryotic-like serine/threonine-protein kinase